MLNAANLRWPAVYSLRKEKAAKEEVGAEARPRRLPGWAVCDPAPPAHNHGPHQEPGIAGPLLPPRPRAGGPRGTTVSTWSLCASRKGLAPPPSIPVAFEGLGLGVGEQEAWRSWLRKPPSGDCAVASAFLAGRQGSRPGGRQGTEPLIGL